MAAPVQGDERETARSYARQWSRTAWALSMLLASLPISSRLFLGAWGFETAGELALLLGMAGMYLHFASRRQSPVLPDPASLLDQAIQLASAGQIDEAIAILTKVIAASPKLWQALQYRGELYLWQNRIEAALRDFDEAIRLAPEESHLCGLREGARALLVGR